jgi:tyrosyl-tRNA synthetase
VGDFFWNQNLEIHMTQLSAAAQLEIIQRGAVHLQPLEDLKRKLESGRQLTIKLGCDPSRPDLHLGHAVVLKKMRQFQDLGHKVILIIGDFTGMIGDPTGKNKTRPPLTLEQTRENGKSYLEQVTLVLDADPNKLEIRYNSEWLEPLDFEDVIRLAAKYTVAQMLTREDFNNRYNTGTPISLHELMYPLAQAYDSVAIKADVELGGTDQLFNLMVGRDIQREYDLEPQVVLTMPLLPGLDGVEKMSKSLDNYIGISEPADVMFSKLMKVPDPLLEQYFELLTDYPLIDIKTILSTNDAKNTHRILAKLLVAAFCWSTKDGLTGKKQAMRSPIDANFFNEISSYPIEDIENAMQRYELVAKGGIPDQMPEVLISSEKFKDGQVGIIALAVEAGFASSNGEARRLIQNRGLKLNGETVTDDKLTLEMLEPVVLQKGKNDFKRLKRE